MTAEPTAAAFGGQVLRGRPLPDRVAELMLETIQTRSLQPGDQLPSERDLGEQFAVSRTVIREALRSLAAKGIVTSTPGRGLTVASVASTAVSDSMSLYLRGNHRQLPYDRVHEVRATLELDIARLAAERATAGEVDHLRETHAQLADLLDDVEQASVADLAFHRELAELTHNPLYMIMLDSISDVLLEIRRATMGNFKDARQGYADHGRILTAIRKHDAGAAREAMRRHLAHAAREWKKLGLVSIDAAAGRAPGDRPTR